MRMHRRSFLLATPAAAALIAAGVAQAGDLPGDRPVAVVSYLEDLMWEAEDRGDSDQAVMLDVLVREDLLRALPFLTVPGGALDRKAERFTTIKPRTQDMLRIMCGDCDVDASLVKNHGDAVLTTERVRYYRRLSQTFVDRLINGDGTAAYAYSVGLKHRIADNVVLDMGGPLRLEVLDRAIVQTGATHLIASKHMRNLMSAAARASSSHNFITWDKDQYGNRTAFYTTRKGRKVQIICTDYDADNRQIIDFNEPGDTTSIYVVALKPDGVVGLMNDLPQVAVLGLISKETAHPDYREHITHGPLYRTRVEWLAEGTILGNHAAIRLSGIAKATVAA